MNVAVIASEAAPFSKTGGLGDVVGALPPHLARGAHVVVVTPRYRGVRGHPSSVSVQVPVRERMETVAFETGLLGPVPVYLASHPHFDRDGYYGTAEGDHPDNAERFVLFQRAALELLHTLRFVPDVIHVHDWQAALIPAYVKTLYAGRFPRTKTVLTIHNLSFQGRFWHWDLPMTGLDWSLFNPRQLEFWGKLNFLKGGIVFADAVTTVSPTYAREIRTREQGCDLDGVLEDRRTAVHGILNGIDTERWDPETDAHIESTYGVRSLDGKARCKEALRKRLGLDGGPAPLFAFVGRLTEQKGVDLMMGALDALLGRGIQVAILGSGEPKYHAVLASAARAHPGRIAVALRFDESLAHEIQAGSDFLLMPSLYEPCGLSQMYAMRYGTVPVVRRTGGLADTVRHGATGIVFNDYRVDALLWAADEALAAFASPERLRALRVAGMNEDFGWSVSAKKYLDLFRSLQ